MTSVIGMLIGGLGLFLLAMGMITDGLKLAGGDALKDILGRYTSTPLKGVASGMLVTGVVQSSSAVTVATIGFVNAGLLTLPRSLAVVYGANVGTTMTGWLVAAVGFDFKLEALALPLVGVGMLGRLLSPAGRLGALGEALAGFGLFFLGIEMLRQAFAGFAGTVDVTSFAPQDGVAVLLYVALGFLMTLLTQSSSAAIALTLTAASGGALALHAAAAMVIGANMGTTSTAVLATIGATANARRVAAAHVLFNGVTGVVALLLLPVLLWITQRTGTALGMQAVPAVVLALFHTVFNVLGVVLMWPFTGRLATFLAGRFVTQAETLSRPVHLDRTVLVAPTLAVEALKSELLRAVDLTRLAAAAAVNAEGEDSEAEREQLRGVSGLIDQVEGFVAELEVGRLPPVSAAELPVLLRTSNYLEDAIALAGALERHRPDLDAVSRPPVVEAVTGFQADIASQLERCRPGTGQFDRQELENGFAALQSRWHELKTTLLEAASRQALPLGRLNGALETLRSMLRMTEQLTKATARMAAVLPVAAEEAALNYGGEASSI